MKSRTLVMKNAGRLRASDQLGWLWHRLEADLEDQRVFSFASRRAGCSLIDAHRLLAAHGPRASLDVVSTDAPLRLPRALAPPHAVESSASHAAAWRIESQASHLLKALYTPLHRCWASQSDWTGVS